MRAATACALLLCLSGLSAPARAQSVSDRPSYRLSYAASGSDRVRVAIEVAEKAHGSGPRTLVMPRAVPMDYGEQPYDRFLHRLEARSGSGEALPVRREEGPRFTLGRPGAALARVSYEVDIGRMEREVLSAVDSSKVRPGYAGLLGYSVFAFIEGLEDAPLRLEVQARPAGRCC